jgi:tellurite resistance protein TerC
MDFNTLNHELVLFILFNIIVLGMLALDLGILQKQKNHTMSFKKAFKWTLIWIGLALSFAGFIYLYDTDPLDPNAHKVRTMEYIAAYLLEKSLSVDNLFVFIMIFQKFKVSQEQQPDILKWGIIGALILRAIMILSGAALVAKFSWILYVFGAFLIYTAIKIFLHRNDEEEEDFDPEKSRLFRFIKKVIPVTPKYHGNQFFVKESGKLFATPLLVVLLMIEASDVMFAFDSIPAVFSVSQNPFIIYTSNIFAILGLRALFFMISGIMELFIYLKMGVSIILGFVGVKMLVPLVGTYILGRELHIPIAISLGVIIAVLALSIILSWPEYKRKHPKVRL